MQKLGLKNVNICNFLNSLYILVLTQAWPTGRFPQRNKQFNIFHTAIHMANFQGVIDVTAISPGRHISNGGPQHSLNPAGARRREVSLVTRAKSGLTFYRKESGEGKYCYCELGSVLRCCTEKSWPLKPAISTSDPSPSLATNVGTSKTIRAQGFEY